MGMRVWRPRTGVTGWEGWVGPSGRGQERRCMYLVCPLEGRCPLKDPKQGARSPTAMTPSPRPVVLPPGRAAGTHGAAS